MAELMDVLGQLVAACRYSQEGFREAAQGVQDPRIAGLFDTWAHQRADFATELEAVGRLHGLLSFAEPPARGWLGMHTAAGGHDDAAILADAEHGEDLALYVYGQALGGPLGPVQEMVQQQRDQIVESRRMIQDLRRSVTQP